MPLCQTFDRAEENSYYTTVGGYYVPMRLAEAVTFKATRDATGDCKALLTVTDGTLSEQSEEFTAVRGQEYRYEFERPTFVRAVEVESITDGFCGWKEPTICLETVRNTSISSNLLSPVSKTETAKR